MTKQEMRDFAQSQVEWYTKQIEWDRKQIERINKDLAQSRKDDKDMAAWAMERYPNDRFAQETYKEGYKSVQTKKLINERSKYYREIKRYGSYVEQYKQEVIKYSEEEITMKNTNKGMTKNEAIQSIVKLSGSTLARIFGSTKYSIIDDGINSMITTAASMDDDAFRKCENWIDVLDTINQHHKQINYYLQANKDFREYIIKYGLDEAKTIFANYVECITREGIQNTKTERDYIRGAKDALCIA